MEIVRDVFQEHETGQQVALHKTVVEDEKIIFKQYNESLIRKLEDKMMQLEEANKDLQGQIIELNQMEIRINHLNRVLLAIRNINQLITQERDLDLLLESACKQLT